MFIFADKTHKIYEMKPQGYQKLMMESIIKTYQKRPRNIANSYKLAERIDHLPRLETFITLKDYKENF